MKERTKEKIISMILAFVMVVSTVATLPMSAYARTAETIVMLSENEVTTDEIIFESVETALESEAITEEITFESAEMDSENEATTEEIISESAEMDSENEVMTEEITSESVETVLVNEIETQTEIQEIMLGNVASVEHEHDGISYLTIS